MKYSNRDIYPLRATFLIALLIFGLLPNLTGAEEVVRTYRTSLFFQGIVNGDVDFGWFRPSGSTPEIKVQHPGYTVLELTDDFNSYIAGATDTIPTHASLLGAGYDWTRIVAVIVDEPYLTASAGLTANAGGIASVCNPGVAEEARRLRAEQFLRLTAEAVKSISTEIRFWVNFSRPELEWMISGMCGTFDLNRSYIDLVSIDYYESYFETPNTQNESGQTCQPNPNVPCYSTVKPYYDWLVDHYIDSPTNPKAPYQQLALVPGVFNHPSGPLTDSMAATILNQYFNYARQQNQGCARSHLNHAKSTSTTKENKCYVWSISGFLNYTFTEAGLTYLGFYDPSSTQIRQVWRGNTPKLNPKWLSVILK